MAAVLLAAFTAGGAGAAAVSPLQPAARPGSHAPAVQTVVSFTFDDGDADQMRAARVLRKYGMHGTFYIITGAVDTPGYMTRRDLRALAVWGDEIGGHTVSHLELPHVTPAEARRQICAGRNVLLKWGYHVTSFAYPGAAYSPQVEAMARGCGFDNARIAAGLRSPGCPGCRVAETIPPRNPYAIRTPGQVDGTWKRAGLERAVTTAEKHGGGWIPLVFHHVCNRNHCGSLSARTSVINAFARWLASRRNLGTSVRTMGQVTGGPLRPATSVPPTRRHDVINPGLETLSNSGTVDPTVEAPGPRAPFPRCWMKGAYGQNTVSWKRIQGGHTGRWAMRLAMTAHHSGDAKLLEQFDLGQCSIPVTAGKSYTVATWYKSTTSTQFSIYYRIPSGRWKYWASSPFYQPAGQWTHAAWHAPPLPAGASGLSFGLTLSRAGVLTTDDYSIGLTQPSTGRRILDITLLALLGLGGAAAVARTLQRRRRRAVQEAADGQPLPEDAAGGLTG